MSDDLDVRRKVIESWVEDGLGVKEISKLHNVSLDDVLVWLGEFNTKATDGDVPVPLRGTDDPVNHPKHYTTHPSGIECIEVTRHMNFNLGNAVKYIWRAGEKDVGKEVEDLEKAVWYLQDEISRLKREHYTGPTVSDDHDKENR